jgi:ATP-dependent exoDNAse (exonuclease V) beta subunit
VPFAAPGHPSGEATAAEAGYGVGRVDLVFRTGKELVVVDYKSDQVPAGDVPAAMTTYRGQAEAYACGVSATTGLRVGDVVFVFARAGAEGRSSGTPAW